MFISLLATGCPASPSFLYMLYNTKQFTVISSLQLKNLKELKVGDEWGDLNSNTYSITIRRRSKLLIVSRINSFFGNYILASEKKGARQQKTTTLFQETISLIWDEMFSHNSRISIIKHLINEDRALIVASQLLSRSFHLICENNLTRNNGVASRYDARPPLFLISVAELHFHSLAREKMCKWTEQKGNN